MKEHNLHKILNEKVIADLEYVRGEECMKLAEALYKGGIRLVSVTVKERGDISSEIAMIRKLKDQYGDTMLIGINNVSSPMEVQEAAAEGAAFVITLGTKQEMIDAAHENGLVAISGAYTPTEIMNAYECQADIVHVYPARLMGPAYFTYACKLLHYIPLMTSCGITRANMMVYMQSGISVVLEDSSFYNRERIANGDWNQITMDTEHFLSILPK